MNTYLKLMLIILCMTISSIVDAQVNPPQLSCIKGDTLVWELPDLNLCGSFNAYEIYMSTNINGPYTLLTSISDPAQLKYPDPNPLNVLRYYYMQGNYNCAGETILQSDTLDNQLPEQFSIQRVSVIDDVKVDITWNSSPSPEVRGYVIYRVTEFGTVPIDTVYDTNNYVDQLGSRPGLGQETYFVLALDDCDNTSAFDLPHTTIHLTSGASICDRTVTLNWQLYQNWNNGIAAQEIWLRKNGGTEEMIATVAATDTTYMLEGAEDGSFYCFRVNAIENVTGEVTRSSESCMNVDVVTPAEDLTLINATVNEDNEVELDWYWNGDADLMTYSIERQMQGDDVLIFDFFAVLPLEERVTFRDSTTDASLAPITYQIFADDPCNNPTFTERVSTIHLQATANKDRTNRIFWTPFNLPTGTLLNYEIYDAADPFGSPIANVSANELEYLDPISTSVAGDAAKCYYVVATSQLELPNGEMLTVRTRSNTACVEQFSLIYAPNAFAPLGTNTIFKPIVLFSEQVSEYQMLIYDRWGGLLFESREIDRGWDGMSGSKMMPKGAYTYFIRLRQPNGEMLEEKGALMLIR